MTFTVKTPKLPKVSKAVPSKRTLLIGLAVLLLVAVFSFAIVKSEQAKLNDERKAVAAANEQKAKDDAVQKKIVSLQEQLKVSETKRKAVCDYTDAASKARATRGLITKPVVACS